MNCVPQDDPKHRPDLKPWRTDLARHMGEVHEIKEAVNNLLNTMETEQVQSHESLRTAYEQGLAQSKGGATDDTTSTVGSQHNKRAQRQYGMQHQQDQLLTAMSVELTVLKEELHARDEALEQLTCRYSATQEENKLLREELEFSKQESTLPEHENTVDMSVVDQKNRTINELEEKLAQSQAEMEEFCGEVEVLMNENEKLSHEMAVTKPHTAQLHQMHEDVAKENHSLRVTIDHLQQRLAVAELENMSAKHDTMTDPMLGKLNLILTQAVTRLGGIQLSSGLLPCQSQLASTSTLADIHNTSNVSHTASRLSDIIIKVDAIHQEIHRVNLIVNTLTEHIHEVNSNSAFLKGQLEGAKSRGSSSTPQTSEAHHSSTPRVRKRRNSNSNLTTNNTSTASTPLRKASPTRTLDLHTADNYDTQSDCLLVCGGSPLTSTVASRLSPPVSMISNVAQGGASHHGGEAHMAVPPTSCTAIREIQMRSSTQTTAVVGHHPTRSLETDSVDVSTISSHNDELDPFRSPPKVGGTGHTTVSKAGSAMRPIAQTTNSPPPGPSNASPKSRMEAARLDKADAIKSVARISPPPMSNGATSSPIPGSHSTTPNPADPPIATPQTQLQLQLQLQQQQQAPPNTATMQQAWPHTTLPLGSYPVIMPGYPPAPMLYPTGAHHGLTPTPPLPAEYYMMLQSITNLAQQQQQQQQQQQLQPVVNSTNTHKHIVDANAQQSMDVSSISSVSLPSPVNGQQHNTTTTTTVPQGTPTAGTPSPPPMLTHQISMPSNIMPSSNIQQPIVHRHTEPQIINVEATSSSVATSPLPPVSGIPDYPSTTASTVSSDGPTRTNHYPPKRLSLIELATFDTDQLQQYEQYLEVPPPREQAPQAGPDVVQLDMQDERGHQQQQHNHKQLQHQDDYNKHDQHMLFMEYRDVNGRTTNDEGFLQPAYDIKYKDINGRHVGQEGFVPPAIGTRGPYGAYRAITLAPLGEYCYDENYVDGNCLKPGDKFFMPPLTKIQLPWGYDEHYRDCNGRGMTELGFIPPCYNDTVIDINGNRVGDAGFIPPPHGTKGNYSGSKEPNVQPLPFGCYDENYRDNSGRKPGDRGFIPPLAAKAGCTVEEASAKLTLGYDRFYRDRNGNPTDHPEFLPPMPTGWPFVTPVYPPQETDGFTPQQQSVPDQPHMNSLDMSSGGEHSVLVDAPRRTPEQIQQAISHMPSLMNHNRNNVTVPLDTTTPLQDRDTHSNTDMRSNSPNRSTSTSTTSTSVRHLRVVNNVGDETKLVDHSDMGRTPTPPRGKSQRGNLVSPDNPLKPEMGPFTSTTEYRAEYSTQRWNENGHHQQQQQQQQHGRANSPNVMYNNSHAQQYSGVPQQGAHQQHHHSMSLSPHLDAAEDGYSDNPNDRSFAENTQRVKDEMLNLKSQIQHMQHHGEGSSGGRSHSESSINNSSNPHSNRESPHPPNNNTNHTTTTTPPQHQKLNTSAEQLAESNARRLKALQVQFSSTTSEIAQTLLNNANARALLQQSSGHSQDEHSELDREMALMKDRLAQIQQQRQELENGTFHAQEFSLNNNSSSANTDTTVISVEDEARSVISRAISNQLPINEIAVTPSPPPGRTQQPSHHNTNNTSIISSNMDNNDNSLVNSILHNSGCSGSNHSVQYIPVDSDEEDDVNVDMHMMNQTALYDPPSPRPTRSCSPSEERWSNSQSIWPPTNTTATTGCSSTSSRSTGGDTSATLSREEAPSPSSDHDNYFNSQQHHQVNTASTGGPLQHSEAHFTAQTEYQAEFSSQ